MLTVNNEKKEITLCFNIDEISLIEAVEIVLHSRKEVFLFFDELFWNAHDIGYYYSQSSDMKQEIIPILYDYNKAVWYIDIAFFLEALGLYIDEKLGTRFAKSFYDLANNSTIDGSDLKDIRSILIGFFEFKHGIFKQNEYTSYVKKARKFQVEPKFYTRKIIQKRAGDEETEDVIMFVIPCFHLVINSIVKKELLHDLMDVQFKLQNKVSKKSVYEYREDMQNAQKLEKYYYYIEGSVKRFLS